MTPSSRRHARSLRLAVALTTALTCTAQSVEAAQWGDDDVEMRVQADSPWGAASHVVLEGEDLYVRVHLHGRPTAKARAQFTSEQARERALAVREGRPFVPTPFVLPDEAVVHLPEQGRGWFDHCRLVLVNVETDVVWWGEAFFADRVDASTRGAVRLGHIPWRAGGSTTLGVIVHPDVVATLDEGTYRVDAVLDCRDAGGDDRTWAGRIVASSDAFEFRAPETVDEFAHLLVREMWAAMGEGDHDRVIARARELRDLAPGFRNDVADRMEGRALVSLGRYREGLDLLESWVARYGEPRGCGLRPGVGALISQSRLALERPPAAAADAPGER